jgi:protein-glutamine gamma-glutamyltransferase
MSWSWKVITGRLGGNWERERRDTLFLLGAILFAVSPHFVHLPLWATGVFVSLFCWRLGLVLSGRWLPRKSVQLLAAAACTLGVYLQYKSLIGRDAGVCLLVLFLGLKLMEIRARRDLFVVLFLCLFLLITSFFYSQGVGTIALVLSAVLGLTSAMITMHYGNAEPGLAKRIRLGGIICLQALPIAAVLFLLFPRLQAPLWSMPDEKTSGRTGLSNQMSPGTIGNLIESSEVVFRVQFHTPAPDKKDMFWRGPVLGSFDGKVWRPPTYPILKPPQPQVVAAVPKALRYSVTLEPQDNDWIYALEMVTQAPKLGEAKALVSPEMVLTSANSIDQRMRYEVESVQEYQLGLNESRLQQQNWLELPSSFNPKTLELAALWASETPSKPKLVERALEMFNTQPFFYTLQPPLLGRNTVDDFLFTTRKGFCEHYSNAFVVLMRALDIPARVVTGFQGGERNPVDGFYTIRSSDAHAWAEVWLEGQGWIRIDPTAAVAPERIDKTVRQARADRSLKEDKPASFAQHWRFRLEAMSNSWNQWVLNYDQKKQRELLARLGLNVTDWRELLGIMALFLALALGAIALITLRPRKPKHPLERSYQKLLTKLNAAGIYAETQDTPLSLACKARAILNPSGQRTLDVVVDRYNTLRYDVVTPSRSEIRALNQSIASLKLAQSLS